MVPLSCSLIPIMDVFSCSCVTCYAASSLLLHSPAPFYIHLSLSTKDTTWSVHCVSTYLSRRYSLYLFLNFNLLDYPVTLDSGRGKRRLLRLRVTRFPRRASSKNKDKGSLKGFFKGRRCWGLPQLVLATVGCVRRYKGFYKGAYTQE